MITADEKLEIIQSVLAAIKTNAKTIDQLTPAQALSESDLIEINRARSVSCAKLIELTKDKLNLPDKEWFAEVKKAISTLSSDVTDTKRALTALSESLTQLGIKQTELQESVTAQAERIALLEAGSDSGDCPSYLLFEGFVDGVEYQLVSPVVDYDVVFDRVHGMFLCRVPSVPGLQARIVPGYDFEYFRGAQLAQYNEAGLDGKARRDRLFVDSDERLYRFDGSALVQVAGVNSRVMTQAEYDALVNPDSDTIYYITE